MKRLVISIVIAGAIGLVAAPFLLAGTGVPKFAGCAGKAQFKPMKVVVSCADGNFYISKLHWTSWTSGNAAATGTAHENDCTPTCVAGKFHTYPVTVKLSRPETCKSGSAWEFTRFWYRYTAAKPMHAKRETTLKAPFLSSAGCKLK